MAILQCRLGLLFIVNILGAWHTSVQLTVPGYCHTVTTPCPLQASLQFHCSFQLNTIVCRYYHDHSMNWMNWVETDSDNTAVWLILYCTRLLVFKFSSVLRDMQTVTVVTFTQLARQPEFMQSRSLVMKKVKGTTAWVLVFKFSYCTTSSSATSMY